MRAVDAVVWSIGGLAGGFGLLLVLAAHRPASWTFPAPHAAPRPEETPSPAPTPRPQAPPTTLPDAYREHVDSRQEFGRAEIEGQVGLSYGFIDHHGRTQRIYCEVPKKDHEREFARYGYDEAEIDAALDPLLRRYLQAELEARGLAPYVRVTVSGGTYSAKSEVPPMDDAQRERVLARIHEFYGRFWEQDAVRKRDALEAALFEQHGLHLENDHWSPDYSQLANRARPILTDCYRALAKAGDGYTERQLLGLFVAFFQEIKYELPPDVVGRRQTSGVWVPTEVLVGDHGDCDSKSTAFAAMWMNVGAPVVLIEVPKHMLVGVEVRPGPREKYVLVNNRYFVICEVAGPGKWHPGEAAPKTLAAVEGHFVYTMLDSRAPPRAADAAPAAAP